MVLSLRSLNDVLYSINHTTEEMHITIIMLLVIVRIWKCNFESIPFQVSKARHKHVYL